MFISKKSFVAIALFLITMNCFSQEIVKANYSFVPTTIFTHLQLDSDLNSNYNINKKLNLKSYKFAIIDPISIEEGYFTIPFQKFELPTSFIFETYQDLYLNQNLKKSFFKVSDLYKVSSRIKN